MFLNDIFLFINNTYLYNYADGEGKRFASH